MHLLFDRYANTFVENSFVVFSNEVLRKFLRKLLLESIFDCHRNFDPVCSSVNQ